MVEINNNKNDGRLIILGRRLFEWAYFPEYDNKLEELANLAMDENWNYKHMKSDRPLPILSNYLRYTFVRLEQEEKILCSDDGNWACFNTGLATDNQESIFALFEINKKQSNPKWYFKKFCKESDYDLTKFEKLPSRANYFDDPSSLVYDTRLELRPNLDHIVEHNINRFPENLKNDKDSLISLLNIAIDRAIKRVERNYKTAVPQYYIDTPSPSKPDKSGIQLLLPLCLQKPNKADLALVVHRIDKVYIGTTVLTLDWAYSNARLIARPDTEWLEP